MPIDFIVTLTVNGISSSHNFSAEKHARVFASPYLKDAKYSVNLAYGKIVLIDTKTGRGLHT